MTSKYESAVHYSASNKSATEHYVYTLELPEKTEQNHIAFKQTVNSSILAKTEKRLGHSVPAKYIEDGKDFRKKYADTWGVKRQGDFYVGPNLMGRLLMELRDNGSHRNRS